MRNDEGQHKNHAPALGDFDGDDRKSVTRCTSRQPCLGGDGPGDAASHSFRGPFLSRTVKHIAMVDAAFELEDPHLAQASLTLAAVEHHVGAGIFKSLEH